MTETKQTPGPWVANNAHQGPRPWRIESDAPGYPNDGWIIGYLEGPDAEANARLIAAAPDLLEASSAILDYATLPEILANNARHEDTVFAIRIGDLRRLSAAIAKAEGRTNA